MVKETKDRERMYFRFMFPKSGVTTDKAYKDNGYVITDINLFKKDNSCTKELDNLQDFYTKVFNDKYGKNWLKRFIEESGL